MYNMMQAQGWGDHGGIFWNISPLALALIAPVIIFLMCWALFWKGLGLWHAARRGQYWWFIVLLLVNTLGVLEIVYLFFIAKLHIHDLFSMKEPHHRS